MPDITDAERTDIVDQRFRADPRWLALFTDSSASVFVTDSNYTRQPLSFGAGTTAINDSDINFGVADVGYSVASIGIYDNMSTGVMRYMHTLSEPVYVAAGQYFSYPAGSLIATFD